MADPSEAGHLLLMRTRVLHAVSPAFSPRRPACDGLLRTAIRTTKRVEAMIQFSGRWRHVAFVRSSPATTNRRSITSTTMRWLAAYHGTARECCRRDIGLELETAGASRRARLEFLSQPASGRARGGDRRSTRCPTRRASRSRRTCGEQQPAADVAWRQYPGRPADHSNDRPCRVCRPRQTPRRSVHRP